jgi:hypothetical protein
MYQTVMGWPVRTKGIYKYVQNLYTQDQEREGNRNYPRGFDQGCVDMVQYLHKNLDY